MQNIIFNLPFAGFCLVIGIGLGLVNLIATPQLTRWSYAGFFGCCAVGIGGAIYIMLT